MNPSVECCALWKSFGLGKRVGLKTLLVGDRRQRESRYARRWALQEVSFSAQPGEAFGIVGHNGSGKTTLLSLLLGTVYPDRGSATLRGRSASLIELGAGFHPELSGRDNIYLYGSILGMRVREVRERFDAIVDFSELEGAVEAPLRTYSAGMVTRLGFSVIANAPAQVLLIDEVLSVGDTRFQEKCHAFLRGFKARGGTLVIVSHDLEALERVCEHGMCLELGINARSGPMREVIGYYRARASGPQPAE
jgi:ABC-type polysaccharide/polyol phosphate transport system ATPase subunit